MSKKIDDRVKVKNKLSPFYKHKGVIISTPYSTKKSYRWVRLDNGLNQIFHKKEIKKC